jgi:hypothetical protein
LSVQLKVAPLRFDMRFLSKTYWLGNGRVSSAFSLCAAIAAIGFLVASGCATPHAVLDFTAPATATAGTTFTVTVTATIEGKRDTIINSYISFISSDPVAVLPSRYLFTPADTGSHTWTNGFTLMTPGNQTISATIYDATGINGTAKVTVSP